MAVTTNSRVFSKPRDGRKRIGVVESKSTKPTTKLRTDKTDQSINTQPINDTPAKQQVIPYGVQAIWGIRDDVAIGNAGEGKTVFVIDSGVSNQTRDINLNAELSRSWIPGESPLSDQLGHGTHVAGIIAAANNQIGVAGVAPGAEVISLKVISNNNEAAPFSSYIEAIDYAISIIDKQKLDLNKVVINMSLGAPASTQMEEAVRRAADKGVRFALSAGNNGVDVDERSPANAGDHPNVYTVSAVDRFNEAPEWNNWDIPSADDINDIDTAAPGVSILSYGGNGELQVLSGTSMAAAHVAGALLIGSMGVDPIINPSSPSGTSALQQPLPTSLMDTSRKSSNHGKGLKSARSHQVQYNEKSDQATKRARQPRLEAINHKFADQIPAAGQTSGYPQWSVESFDLFSSTRFNQQPESFGRTHNSLIAAY